MATKDETLIREIVREEIKLARTAPDTPYVRRSLRGQYGLGNLTGN